MGSNFLVKQNKNTRTQQLLCRCGYEYQSTAFAGQCSYRSVPTLSSVLVECCYLEEPECTNLYIVMSLHWSHLLHGLIYLGKQCNCGSEMKSPFECTASENTTLTEDIICAIVHG